MNMVKASDLFKIEYGNFKKSKTKLEEGIIPVVSSKGTNQGIHGFYSVQASYVNVITIARTGSICSSFYHDYPVCVDDNCLVLKPKTDLSNTEMALYAFLMTKEKFKYLYGRQVTPSRLGETLIPSQDEIKRLIPEGLNFNTAISQQIEDSDKPASDKTVSLTPVSDWKDYKVGDLFTVEIAKSIDVNKTTPGNKPLVGRTKQNNGILKFVEAVEPKLTQGNCISVPMVGASTYRSSYQKDDFMAVQNIGVLRLRGRTLTPFIAEFIQTLLLKNRPKYSYGRTLNKTTLFETIIPLPSIQNPETNEWEPDWQYMEDYIKSLSYSSNL